MKSIFFESEPIRDSLSERQPDITLNSPEKTVKATYISRKLFEPKKSFDFCEELRSLKFPKLAI